MGLFDDLRKGAEEGLKAAHEGVKNFNAEEAVKAVAEGAGAAAKNISEGVQNFDAGEALQKAEEMAAAGVSNVTKAVDGALNRTEEAAPDANREFIMMLSYLAAADGNASREEKTKICEMAAQIDEAAGEWCDGVIEECINQVAAESSEFGQLNAAKICARRTLDGISPSLEEQKLLCWNLFAVAGADGISIEEADFIRYTCEQVGLDKAIVEELSAYNDTIAELADAKADLKSSTASYVEIEPLVNQLTEREQTIITAAQALVTDK